MKKLYAKITFLSALAFLLIPMENFAQQMLFSEDFEGPFSWAHPPNTFNDRWTSGSCFVINGKSAYVKASYTTDCRKGGPLDLIMSKKISAKCYRNIMLSFKWKSDALYNGEVRGSVWISRDGSNWKRITTGGNSFDNAGYYYDQPEPVTQTLNLTEVADVISEDFYLGFKAEAASPSRNFVIDDISVTASPMAKPFADAGEGGGTCHLERFPLNGSASPGEPYFIKTNNTPLDIAKNSYVRSEIRVSGVPYPFSAKDILSVTVNISAFRASDINLQLSAPNGSMVNLTTPRPLLTLGSNYTNTTFSDTSANDLNSGTPPYSGSYKPASGLSKLTGDINGTWKLGVGNSNQLLGCTLESWKITFRNGVVVEWNPFHLVVNYWEAKADFLAQRDADLTLKVTDMYGCEASDNVSVSIFDDPVIQSHPVDAEVLAASTATFSVSASGPELSYRWEYSDGADWVTANEGDIYSGTSTSVLTVNSSYSLNGTSYRCVVRDRCSNELTTNPASLKVNFSALTAQVSRSSALACPENEPVIFTAGFHSSDLTFYYQWYVDKGFGPEAIGPLLQPGQSFENDDFRLYPSQISSYIFAGILEIKPPSDVKHDHSYGVFYMRPDGVVNISGAEFSGVYPSVSFNSQPADQQARAGEPAFYSASASGLGNTYQWQEFNTQQWSDINEGGNYSITQNGYDQILTILQVTRKMDGFAYRLCVKDGCTGADTSDSASLNILKRPKPLREASPEAAPATSGISVYPNPTSGITFIDFTMSAGSRISIKVTDMIGKSIMTREINVQGGKTRFEADLSTYPDGVYFIQTNDGTVARNFKLIKE